MSFNTNTSSRTCIEQAFGALNGRFRLLKEIELTNVTLVSQTTVACCILRTLYVKQGKWIFFKINTHILCTIYFSNHGFLLLRKDIEEYFEGDTVDDSNEQYTVHHNQIEEDIHDQICKTLYNTI